MLANCCGLRGIRIFQRCPYWKIINFLVVTITPVCVRPHHTFLSLTDCFPITINCYCMNISCPFHYFRDIFLFFSPSLGSLWYECTPAYVGVHVHCPIQDTVSWECVILVRFCINCLGFRIWSISKCSVSLDYAPWIMTTWPFKYPYTCFYKVLSYFKSVFQFCRVTFVIKVDIFMYSCRSNRTNWPFFLHLSFLMLCTHGFREPVTIILHSPTLMLNTVDKHIVTSVKSPTEVKKKL